VARKFGASEAECKRALEQDPRFAPALTVLGAVYLQQERYPEAIAVLRDAWQREKNYTTLGAVLGYAYGVSGNAQQARAVLQELQELSKQTRVSPRELAAIHLGLGAKEEALTLLEQAYREGTEGMNQIKVHPMFDSLRDEPRFQKIIADMKFPP
jgi:tetratricopeptide (TPR) repeat protein